MSVMLFEAKFFGRIGRGCCNRLSIVEIPLRDSLAGAIIRVSRTAKGGMGYEGY